MTETEISLLVIAIIMWSVAITAGLLDSYGSK